MIIHLGPGLPADLGAAYPGVLSRRTTSPPLFGLAPDEVYHAASVAGDAVSSYLTFSPLPIRSPSGESTGGIFSVALSVGSPPLGVTQHPVLRSSDFPHPGLEPLAVARRRDHPNRSCIRTVPDRFRSRMFVNSI